jgi:hypothetical protein
MQGWVSPSSLGDESHEPLERRTLAFERELTRGISRPEGVERPVGVEHAEQVVQAIVERERIALDVEEEISGGGHGKRGEAPFRLRFVARRGQQQLVPRLPAAPPLELESGLLADALQGRSTDPVEGRRQR